METNRILSQEYIDYAEKAYPSNHTFRIKNHSLTPKCKLKLRYHKIRKLYPTPLTSLLDISCSKGFFVFSALNSPQCERSLGIDINEYDINFCTQLKNQLQAQHAHFALLRLHELASQIKHFGGPFQTVLLINAYQYFYFGSVRSSECYLSHEVILDYLAQICSQRVIFNNRIDLESCQNKFHVERNLVAAQDYHQDAFLTAAAKFFRITTHGKIGRYPLFALDKI